MPDIKSLIFGVAETHRAAAQAAHDARQPEVDRLKQLNAELLAALKNAAAYLEAQRCWLKSDANPAAHGQPLHLREAASEQVSAELTQIYAAIANAERAK